MKRILLVEDDRWLAESYRSALGSYMVDIVSSGNQAIEAIDDTAYDLVIADVMLDEGLVIDLLHEFQSYEDTARLPVILCTSLASSLSLDDVAAYGVIAVLDKALMTPHDLRVAVQQAHHAKVM